MINTLEITEDRFEFVAETTARELLGDEERFNVFDLMDSPLIVSCLEDESGKKFDVKIDRPAFSSEEFIDIYNRASPHDRQQSASAIAGDWVLATGRAGSYFMDLAKRHAKIPGWNEMLERGDSYTQLATNANRPTLEHRSQKEFDEWRAKLPEVKSVDELRKQLITEYQNEVSQAIENILSRQHDPEKTERLKTQTLERIQSAPTMLMLKKLESLGFTGARSTLSHLIALEFNNRRKQRSNDVIKWFSRKPFSERIDTQNLLLSVLTGRDPEITEKYIRSSLDRIIRSQLSSLGYVSCKDVNGKWGVVPLTDLGSYGSGAIRDMRQLNDDNWRTVSLNGDYVAEELRVQTAHQYQKSGKITEKVRVFHRNAEKRKLMLAKPIIRWTVDGTKRTPDLSFSVENDDDSDIPTTTIHDGVFGLVIVQYLSDNIRLPDTLPIGGRGREQAMGAAQLPLLSIMFKNKIMKSDFVEKIESLAS